MTTETTDDGRAVIDELVASVKAARAQEKDESLPGLAELVAERARIYVWHQWLDGESLSYIQAQNPMSAREVKRILEGPPPESLRTDPRMVGRRYFWIGIEGFTNPATGGKDPFIIVRQPRRTPGAVFRKALSRIEGEIRKTHPKARLSTSAMMVERLPPDAAERFITVRGFLGWSFDGEANIAAIDPLSLNPLKLREEGRQIPDFDGSLPARPQVDLYIAETAAAAAATLISLQAAEGAIANLEKFAADGAAHTRSMIGTVVWLRSMLVQDDCRALREANASIFRLRHPGFCDLAERALERMGGTATVGDYVGTSGPF